MHKAMAAAYALAGNRLFAQGEDFATTGEFGPAQRPDGA
jgi:hypothetical protein